MGIVKFSTLSTLQLQCISYVKSVLFGSKVKVSMSAEMDLSCCVEKKYLAVWDSGCGGESHTRQKRLLSQENRELKGGLILMSKLLAQVIKK